MHQSDQCTQFTGLGVASGTIFTGFSPGCDLLLVSTPDRRIHEKFECAFSAFAWFAQYIETSVKGGYQVMDILQSLAGGCRVYQHGVETGPVVGHLHTNAFRLGKELNID